MGTLRDYLNYLSMGPPSTELIAGMTTFLTMVYIVFVNPQILGAAQMDPKVVFTTCLIAGIGSIAMGILLTYPWRWLRQ